MLAHRRRHFEQEIRKRSCATGVMYIPQEMVACLDRPRANGFDTKPFPGVPPMHADQPAS